MANEKEFELKITRQNTAIVVLLVLAFSAGFYLVSPAFFAGPTGGSFAGPTGGSIAPAETGGSGSGQLVADLMDEVTCTCGCGLTLEQCEVNDPTCSVRPDIISRIRRLAEEGMTKEEVVAVLQSPGTGTEAPDTGTETPGTGTEAPDTGTETGGTGAEVSAGNDPTIGPEEATVTIVEFSDYECPFCARVEPTVKSVLEEYGDSVRLVYKHFPLGFHQYAQKAAEASECAYEQGMFWEYHDVLFNNQDSLDRESLKGFATGLGMDSAEFNSCLDSGRYEDEVLQDFQEGQAAGVTGTPTFFINGEKLVGAQPFEAFEQLIERELGQG